LLNQSESLPPIVLVVAIENQFSSFLNFLRVINILSGFTTNLEPDINIKIKKLEPSGFNLFKVFPIPNIQFLPL
jgi:hypothetical protein